MTSSNRTSPFKAAIVQHAPVFLNLEESLKKACGLIEEAAGEGAAVIAFPETWLPGYPAWIDSSPKAALWDYPPAKRLFRVLADNSVSIPGDGIDQLAEAARKTGAHIVMGAHERAGGTLYNTMIFVPPDGSGIRFHRKLMPTYTERMVWGRGDGSTMTVVEGGFGNLGGLICWEHWMPLARAAMHAMKETVHVAQWPSVRDLHLLASRYYAFEGQCFVLAAGTVLTRGDMIEGYRSLGQTDPEVLELLESIPGSAEDLVFGGGSAVIGPDSNFVEGPLAGEACILYAEIDPKKISEGQFYLDTDGHYSRPDVFRLEVNTRPLANVVFGERAEE